MELVDQAGKSMDGVETRALTWGGGGGGGEDMTLLHYIQG